MTAPAQDWHRTGGAQWTRADGRARVTQDTYQPAWTAEISDGTIRRTYTLGEAISWAERQIEKYRVELPPRWTP
jgi:hypothetical protein